MDSFADIIGLWPTTAAFASDMKIRGVTARQWKNRDRIPANFWIDIVAVSARRGFSQVTLKLLANLAARNETAAA